MKLTIVFFLLFGFVGMASQGYSQNTRLNVSLKNGTIHQLIDQIEQQSEFSFFYKNDQIKLKKPINIHEKDVLISDVLDKALAGTGLTYSVVDKIIVIRPEKMTQAQKTVKGTVTDKDGKPLPGVNILIKGTQQGTISGTDGTYTIDVPDNAVLVFSFVGYETKEVPVDNKTTINVTLSEESIGLKEVITVGYGTVRKGALTGSVASLKADELVNNNPTDITQGLQGKISGVQITTASGDPSAGSAIVIRGASSVTAGTAPLFVIDGVPYNPNGGEIAGAPIGTNNSTNPLDFINPQDIKSISVLKDASSTAIYGSQGANGVIVIETKSGAGIRQKAQIGLNVYWGFNTVDRLVPVLSGNEFIEYRREVDPYGYLFYKELDRTKPRDPYSLPQHDWQKEILRKGFKQNYDFSIRGNSGKTNYLISLGVYDNNGIVENNDNQRYTARLNINHQQSKKLRLGVNMYGNFSQFNGATQSGGGQIYNGVVQNLLISKPVELYNPSFDPGDRYISPASMIFDAYSQTNTMRFSSNAYLHWNITQNIKFIGNFAGTLISSKGSQFYGKNTSWGNGTNGKAFLSERRTINMFGNAQLHYNKNFNPNNTLHAFVSAEFGQYDHERFSVNTTDFIDESTGVFDISKGAIIAGADSYKYINRRSSFFGRVNYTLMQKHFFTATFRADGSDKFGPDNRWGLFPSFAYSWLFLKNTDSHIMNLGKVRLSYGVTGNDRIGNYLYDANLGNAFYNGVLGLAPANMPNPELKWETTYQFNVGLDLGFINNRLTMNVDLYKKTTRDMLLNAPQAGRTGFSYQTQNIGSLENKGIEFHLSSINIRNNRFEWTTDFNISKNINKVTDLGPIDFITVNVGGGWIKDLGRVEEGHPIGSMYGYVWDGVYQIDDFTWQNNSDPNIPYANRNYTLKEGVVAVNGMNVIPGSLKFKDLNNDGIIDLDNDRDFIGISDPKFFGGITNTIKFLGFDLSIFIDGMYGNQVFNEANFRLQGAYKATYMNVTKYFYYNHWTPENPTNKFGNYTDPGTNPTARLSSSYYVEDASFIRISNISLGYTFQKAALKKAGVQSLRIYASGNNLKTWTNYSGYYPELASTNPLLRGVDHISYPRSKVLLFGLNVTF